MNQVFNSRPAKDLQKSLAIKDRLIDQCIRSGDHDAVDMLVEEKHQIMNELRRRKNLMDEMRADNNFSQIFIRTMCSSMANPSKAEQYSRWEEKY